MRKKLVQRTFIGDDDDLAEYDGTEGGSSTTTSLSLPTGHQSETASPGYDWLEIARTPVVKKEVDPQFPTCLLLQCEKYQDDDLIRFELFVKSTSRGESESRSVEIKYSELRDFAGTKSFDLSGSSTSPSLLKSGLAKHHSNL